MNFKPDENIFRFLFVSPAWFVGATDRKDFDLTVSFPSFDRKSKDELALNGPYSRSKFILSVEVAPVEKKVGVVQPMYEWVGEEVSALLGGFYGKLVLNLGHYQAGRFLTVPATWDRPCESHAKPPFNSTPRKPDGPKLELPLAAEMIANYIADNREDKRLSYVLRACEFYRMALENYHERPEMSFTLLASALESRARSFPAIEGLHRLVFRNGLTVADADFAHVSIRRIDVSAESFAKAETGQQELPIASECDTSSEASSSPATACAKSIALAREGGNYIAMSFTTANATSVAVGISCVNYCDFLRHTLPQALRFFSDITVITSSADQDSIEHAHALGATTWLSELWFGGGAAFNKSAAINEWLATRPPGWTLLLDADIYIPDAFIFDLGILNPANLYSVPRRICELEWDWVGPLARRPEYPLLIPPVKNGRVWRRPTSNPAALSGYFHLWNRAASNRHYYPGSTTAAEYDVEFALQFPEENRRYLPGEVIHLGPVRQNWSGRVSTPWSLTPVDPSFIPDSLKSAGATQIYRFKIGSRNPTFLCTSANDAWVYRTVAATFAWQVQKETYVQQTLRHVPTPRVLSITDSAYVMEYGGLTAEGLAALPVGFFSACGQILRNLHEESLEPARLFQTRYAKAPWNSMFGYHLRLSQCARWLQRIPATSPVAAPLRTLLDRMESDAAVQDAFAASRFCFTHGDYKTANILTDGTQPINVIDFEHAVYGDPDSDLHWFCQRAQAEGYPLDYLKAFVNTYDPGPTFSRKKDFYRYFRAFQKVILAPTKEQPDLLGWVEAIRDGSDPYLQCKLV